MPQCRSCRKLVPEGIKFCRHCGERVQPGDQSPPNRPASSGKSTSATTVVVILAIVGVVALVFFGGIGILAMRSVRTARAEAREKVSRNNLKCIAIAMHYYNEVHDSFPPGGTFDRDGDGLQSWQTLLLPYLDQAHVYEQMMRTNKPWDDPANSAQTSLVVKTYIHPHYHETTDSRGFGLSHYAGNPNVLLRNRVLKDLDILDGASHTILAGEVSAGFKPWADPTNVRDPANGLGGGSNAYGGVPPNGPNILMSDGTVRTISSNISLDVLKALSTPRGGEPANDF